jgi:hypothetical protein
VDSQFELVFLSMGLISELNYLFVSSGNAHQITHLFSNIVSNLCSPIWVIQMNTVAQGRAIYPSSSLLSSPSCRGITI